MSTYYVVFIGKKIRVCDSLFECQRRVLFIKVGYTKLIGHAMKQYKFKCFCNTPKYALIVL